MNKLISALLTAALLIASNAYADTLKVKNTCFQSLDYNNLYLLVPIKLQSPKLDKDFNKLLHLHCINEQCEGMTMNTNIANNEISMFDFNIIYNLKRTVNKPGYAVLEWGLNLVTINFNTKKVTWNESGTSDYALVSGTATCS